MIQVHPGRWLVDGNPQIILFDIATVSDKLFEYKQLFYENTKIGIPHQDVECNDAVLFGTMVGKFIEEVSTVGFFFFFYQFISIKYFIADTVSL